jgi:hypothetical protein
MKVKRLPNKDNFTILDNIVINDFDYSGTMMRTMNHTYMYLAIINIQGNIMPTIQYVPKDAVKLP